MDTPTDENIVVYLGSWPKVIGLLLFLLGGAALLVFGLFVVGAMGVQAPFGAMPAEIWLIPLWSIVAVPLGLALRRAVKVSWVCVVGVLWLAPAMGFVLWMCVQGAFHATPRI